MTKHTAMKHLNMTEFMKLMRDLMDCQIRFVFGVTKDNYLAIIVENEPVIFVSPSYYLNANEAWESVHAMNRAHDITCNEACAIYVSHQFALAIQSN